MKHKKELAAMASAGICIIVLVILNLGISFAGTFKLNQETNQYKSSSLELQDGTSLNQETFVRGQIADIHIDSNLSDVGQAAQGDIKNGAEFLCPKAVSMVLNEADVEALKSGEYENLPQGKDIIQMVINEIYARNGYRFENQELQAYFEAQSWYAPSTDNASDMDSIYAGMPEIDKANIDMLKDER